MSVSTIFNDLPLYIITFSFDFYTQFLRCSRINYISIILRWRWVNNKMASILKETVICFNCYWKWFMKKELVFRWQVGHEGQVRRKCYDRWTQLGYTGRTWFTWWTDRQNNLPVVDMVYIYKVQAEKLVFRWYRGNGMVGRHGVGGVGVDLNVVLCPTEC